MRQELLALLDLAKQNINGAIGEITDFSTNTFTTPDENLKIVTAIEALDRALKVIEALSINE